MYEELLQTFKDKLVGMGYSQEEIEEYMRGNIPTDFISDFLVQAGELWDVEFPIEEKEDV